MSDVYAICWNCGGITCESDDVCTNCFWTVDTFTETPRTWLMDYAIFKAIPVWLIDNDSQEWVFEPNGDIRLLAEDELAPDEALLFEEMVWTND